MPQKTDRLQGGPARPTYEVSLAALVDLGRGAHLCVTNRALKLLPPLLLLLSYCSFFVRVVAKSNRLRQLSWAMKSLPWFWNKNLFYRKTNFLGLIMGPSHWLFRAFKLLPTFKMLLIMIRTYLNAVFPYFFFYLVPLEISAL